MDFGTEELLSLPVRTLAQNRSEVDRQVSFLRGREGIAVKSYSAAAGKFGFDVVAVELRGVVADMIDLVGAWGFDVAEIERAGDGGDQDVAVLALGSAEMQMREAKNDTAARIAESGAAAIEGRHVRPDLYETVRDRGADKRIAAPIDTDERIDITGQIPNRSGSRLLGLDRLPHDRQRGADKDYETGEATDP